MRGNGEGSKRGVAAKPAELSPRELEAAELGFRRLLRSRRFPSAFLIRHTADLLAQARLEYARHIAAGDEIENPTSWIIHCAWRRTQNLLEHQRRKPPPIVIEEGEEFRSSSPGPEEEVVQEDRYRRLQAAIGHLTAEERKVIALTYFEGMSVREASRALKWDKSKGDRRHHAALEHLRELIGAKDMEAFQIEIGIAAYASLAAERQTGPLASAAHAVGDGIAALLDRVQETARRLLLGGAADPGIGTAAGAVTRTAGACGALAVACLATGVVGPGVGGIDVIAHHSRPSHATVRRHAAPEASPQRTEPLIEAPQTSSPGQSAVQRKSRKEAVREGAQKGTVTEAVARPTTSEPSSSRTVPPQEVETGFGSFGGESQSTEPSPPSASTQSGGTAPTPSRSTGSSGSSGSAPPASGRQVESEFGL